MKTDTTHRRKTLPPHKRFIISMRWNDAWLSNMDCDGDGLLDRHSGFTSYIGSGAWLTNHQSGTDVDGNGKKCRWTYSVKIVAAPADATKVGEVWYAADGTEIGPDIWGFLISSHRLAWSPIH